jgi:short-subunit dehydrogenase
MDSYADRVVLITGAASGLGRRLAQRLAAEGACVAALDVQADGLASLEAELKAAGARCAAAVADVTDADAVAAAVADLEGRLGPTDLLIASAGVGRETNAAHFSAAVVGQTLRVNLIGVANAIAAVLPGMRDRRRGHLAVLSSLASYRGLPRMAAYCASKAGVNALMDALRVELRPVGVACTTVCPCWVRTPMTAGVDLPGVHMLEVDDAARRILAALRRRRPFVAFPAADVWRVRLLRYLPRPVSDWLVARWLRSLQR